MESVALPILIFSGAALLLTVGMYVAGWIVGPSRSGRVKEMPYESGMDPIHDTRRRFDVRFHLVAVAFLLFDVELLFLYPWAVASRPAAVEAGEAASPGPLGVDAAVAGGLVESRGLVFGGAMVFFGLLAAGFIYDWRKGIFQWK
jgi:NADH-quinone oxidoreductase subunit A